MRWLVVAASLAAAGCTRSAPGPAPAPGPRKAPGRDRDPPTPPDVGPAGDPAALITTSCVLHAGGGERSGKNGVTTRAKCWFNAECVNTPGQAAPGDGFVEVTCDFRSCRCEWSMAHENHPGGDARKLWSTFTIESPCGGEMGEKLLVERCIEGYGLKLHKLDSP